MSFILNILESSDRRRAELEALPWTRAMVEGRASKTAYLSFLLDLYHVVKHFCPIMAAAVSRCDKDSEQLRMHLYGSLSEERGHEKMVLDDLNFFGVPELEVRSRKPSPPVTTLVGCNYYLVEREHPAMVFGFLYTQELISSCYAGLVATNMAEALDVEGKSGFSFLSSHSSLDQEHMARMHKVLGSLEDAGAQEKIIHAINLNFYLLKEWGLYMAEEGSTPRSGSALHG